MKSLTEAMQFLEYTPHDENELPFPNPTNLFPSDGEDLACMVMANARFLQNKIKGTI